MSRQWIDYSGVWYCASFCVYRHARLSHQQAARVTLRSNQENQDKMWSQVADHRRHWKGLEFKQIVV